MDRMTEELPGAGQRGGWLRRCLWRAAAATALIVLLPALTSVASAKSFPVGTVGGSTPAVTVDSGGTAHVVWKAPVSPTNIGLSPLVVCNLPAGATTCSSEAALNAPDNATGSSLNYATLSNSVYGAPAIFSSGQYLVVISTYFVLGQSSVPNSDAVEFEWESADGGATWSNPAPIGTFSNTFNSSLDTGEQIVLDPSAGLFINGPWGSPVGNSSAFGQFNVQADGAATSFPAADAAGDPPGLALNQVGPDGGTGDVTPSAALTLNPAPTPGNGTGPLDASIGQSGASIVGVFDNAQDGFDFHYAYLNPGTPLTATDIDNSANWTTKHMPASKALSQPSMAGGTTGPYLLDSTPGYPDLTAWNASTSSFEPASEVDCGAVSTSGGGLGTENLGEDPSGRLEMVYTTNANNTSALTLVDLRLTKLGYVQNYPVQIDSGGAYGSPRVAADASGNGLVVWTAGADIDATWLPGAEKATGLPNCGPLLSKLRETPSEWVASSRTATIAEVPHRLSVGTVFHVTLSEPATLKFAFSREEAGRRVGKKCEAVTKQDAHKAACKRFVPAGAVTLIGKRGANTVRFAGQTDNAGPLGVGTFSVVLHGTGEAGLTGTSNTLLFTIAAKS